MKKKQLIILTTIMTIACILAPPISTGDPDSLDPFYSSNDEWDSRRIPLIKPYEARKIDAIPGWFINLHLPFEQRADDLKSYGSIDGVEKMAIQNNIILVYTPVVDETAVSLNYLIAHWFFISPEEKLELGFDNERQFIETTRKYGIQEIIWMSPDDIYRRFQENGCLNWIPNCKK